jgi:CheY-like chemotaxis protein
MLSVSDTGCGMDEETQLHIFEPFLPPRKKERERGWAGDRLRYRETARRIHIGIFRNRQGIGIQDFPAESERRGKKSDEHDHEPRQILRGDETILVVEDNETVRLFACDMLEDLGYRVLSAGTADAGMKLSRSFDGVIHLLLSDVIMPKMNGRELYEEMKKDRPGMKVLFMSGYTGSIIGHHGILERGINLLQKPFTIESLSRKVRSILEE